MRGRPGGGGRNVVDDRGVVVVQHGLWMMADVDRVNAQREWHAVEIVSVNGIAVDGGLGWIGLMMMMSCVQGCTSCERGMNRCEWECMSCVDV